MSTFTFIHTADLHLDRPLGSLKRRHGEAAAKVEQASRNAVKRLCEFAIERQVGAIAIAGDLFDGPLRDAGAALWIESEFRQVVRNGIPVVLIRGNHDAISLVANQHQWSEGIVEFGTGTASTFQHPSLPLAFHGQSFGAKCEQVDMAASYPSPIPGCFNVGLLHTSLGGVESHDAYAPTNVTTLNSKGYDYWALGHIHARSQASLSNDCFVGYSGNIQGCHINECGPKGFSLVRVVDQAIDRIDFVPTDSIRWHHFKLDVSDCVSQAEIPDLLRDNIDSIVSQLDGLPLISRIELTGSTKLHAELHQSLNGGELAEAFQDELERHGDYMLERVTLSTTTKRHVSTHELDGPLKTLSEIMQEALGSEEVMQELLTSVQPLFDRIRRSELQEAKWPLVDPNREREALTSYLKQAGELIAASLTAD